MRRRDGVAAARRVALSGAWRPRHVLDTAHVLAARRRRDADEDHLRAAAGWLAAAHAATGGRGLAAGYALGSGWLAAYPETTGYTVETLYDLAIALDDPECRELARRLARWLLEVQSPDGSYPGSTLDVAGSPSVFNTGMILFGLTRASDEERDAAFLSAATRAACWLRDVQSQEGMWRRHTYRQRLHAYEARVAWGLLEVWKRCGDDSLRLCAARQLSWVRSLQAANGFIEHMDFAGDWPHTHTIAYTVRGLLESGVLLDEPTLVGAAKSVADALLHAFERSGRLAGRYDDHWRPASASVCVTGVAQMAICWARLAQHAGDLRYLNAALKARDFLRSSQIRSGDARRVRGAWPGSLPVWGDYKPLVLPEWGVKFACDALMTVDSVYSAARGGEP